MSPLHWSIPERGLKVNHSFEIPTGEESNQIILGSAGWKGREKEGHAVHSLDSPQRDGFAKGPSL